MKKTYKKIGFCALTGMWLALSSIPSYAIVRHIDLEADLVFVGKTDEEISLVCRTEDVPENILERDDGWKGFRVQGVLDFSMTGVLSKLSGILAENGIGIFAVSTYNTRLRHKLEKLAEDHPDQIRKRGGGGSGPSEYTVPIACISIRPPYSEARKKADSERALRAGRRPPSGRSK